MVADACRCAGYEIGDFCMAYVDGMVKLGRLVDIFENGSEALLECPETGDEFTVDAVDILQTDPAVRTAIRRAVLEKQNA